MKSELLRAMLTTLLCVAAPTLAADQPAADQPGAEKPPEKPTPAASPSQPAADKPAAGKPPEKGAETPLWTPNDPDEAVADKIADKLNAAQKMFYDAIMARDESVRIRRLQEASDIVQKLYEMPVNRPHLAALIQNIGQMYQLNRMPGKSIEWWQRLAVVEPENWRAWSKIVQCAQALDLMRERDEAREKVFALNKEGKVDQKLYCREQFTVGDEYVMAMEYFKPDGRFGVELSFLVSRPESPEQLNRRYTFGELKSDTLVARSVQAIGPIDKMYSIDGFDMNGQWLLSMTEKHLPYETIRDMIVADLKKKPITLSPAKKPEPTVEKPPDKPPDKLPEKSPEPAAEQAPEKKPEPTAEKAAEKAPAKVQEKQEAKGEEKL